MVTKSRFDDISDENGFDLNFDRFGRDCPTKNSRRRVRMRRCVSRNEMPINLQSPVPFFLFIFLYFSDSTTNPRTTKLARIRSNRGSKTRFR